MNKTNTQRRRRLGGCSLAGALVACCTSAFAAGTLTVPAEGMRVSTGATYDSAEINGLLVVTNCTVVATKVTVNSTAANFDAVRLEKDGIFAFEELSDATANTMPCFYFAGGRIEDRAIGKYYHTAFTTPTWMGGFKFIGVDRNQIFFNINGNPCNLGSQSTWPNVYVSGAGNFILNGSGWEPSLSVGGACGKFVYSHTGDTYVKGHLTLAANGDDNLPSGQGLGGFYVQEYAQVSIAATSQSVNSFQTSGEGYLKGTAGSKLSIGKNVDASVFAGVVQGSTKVVKAGAGTMTVFTATAPSFEIEEGSVVLTESLTLGADNSDSTLDMSNFLSGAGATLVKTGSGTLTLTGATEFRGSIDVCGGAVAFDESFASGYMTPTLAIADGAKVKIADGVCLRVTSLVINGVQQGEDDYTGTGGTGTVIGAIEGTGVISTRLPPGSATWIGAGSTDRLTDAANWDCTQQIYFKEPTLKATFASGGTQTTVASDAALKGIVWNSGVSSFTLVALTGSECLQLGSAGFAAAANGSGKYNPFTVGVPVAPAADQEWSVPEGLTLTVSAPFRNVDAVPSTACVTKLGAGRLDLKSAASTFSGSFYLKEGVTYAYGNEPFGAGGGTVRVKARDWNGRRLHLSNVTMSNPVTLEDNYGDRCTLRSMAGTTNVLKGLVTSTSCSALAVEAGSRLVFEGGYGTEKARSYVNWICDGEVVVTNRPFIVGEYAPNSMNLHFWNADN